MDPQNIFQSTEEMLQDYPGIMAQIRENKRNYFRQQDRLYTQNRETLTQIRNDFSIPTMAAKLKKMDELHEQTSDELAKVTRQYHIRQNQLYAHLNSLRSRESRESLSRNLHVPSLELDQLEGQQQENLENLRALTLETEQLEEALHNALTEPGNDLELD